MGDALVAAKKVPNPIEKKVPNPIDKHVGSRVRMRRMMLGMSQEKLGDALDLTFQQVQKYEKGTNRIGASRLQHIANILQVPVEFFFGNCGKFAGQKLQVLRDAGAAEVERTCGPRIRAAAAPIGGDDLSVSGR